MTNLFMAANDPVFAALNGALVRHKLGRDADFILVDAHGEATSEKMALGHMVDSRASMLVGTQLVLLGKVEWEFTTLLEIERRSALTQARLLILALEMWGRIGRFIG